MDHATSHGVHPFSRPCTFVYGAIFIYDMSKKRPGVYRFGTDLEFYRALKDLCLKYGIIFQGDNDGNKGKGDRPT